MSERLVHMAGKKFGKYVPKESFDPDEEYQAYINQKDYIKEAVNIHKSQLKRRSHLRGFVGDSQG